MKNWHGLKGKDQNSTTFSGILQALLEKHKPRKDGDDNNFEENLCLKKLYIIYMCVHVCVNGERVREVSFSLIRIVIFFDILENTFKEEKININLKSGIITVWIINFCSFQTFI